jgi:hypothetical protein
MSRDLKGVLQREHAEIGTFRRRSRVSGRASVHLTGHPWRMMPAQFAGGQSLKTSIGNRLLSLWS